MKASSFKYLPYLLVLIFAGLSFYFYSQTKTKDATIDKQSTYIRDVNTSLNAYVVSLTKANGKILQVQAFYNLNARNLLSGDRTAGIQALQNMAEFKTVDIEDAPYTPKLLNL